MKAISEIPSPKKNMKKAKSLKKSVKEINSSKRRSPRKLVTKIDEINKASGRVSKRTLISQSTILENAEAVRQIK